MTFPFTGKFKVTAIFGASDQELWANNGHEGIDFASQGDKTIVSVTEGTVGWVKRSNKGFGNHVWVKNDDGYGCIYAHMSSILVKAGDKVGAGTALGIQGATGNVTGPHLHFEVHASHTFYYHRDLINPANYLGINTYGLLGKVFTGGGAITYPEHNSYVDNGSYDSDIGGGSNDGTTGSLDQSFIEAIVNSQLYKVIGDPVYGDILYGRKYRVLIADSNNNSIDVSNLRCTFEIKKTAYAEVNYSIITIYNLSAQTESQMMTTAKRVVVEAGYVTGQYGTIFDGFVFQAIRGKENGTDYYLKFICLDSSRYLDEAVVNLSLTNYATMRQVVYNCTKASTETINLGQIQVPNVSYPRGKVLFGMAKEYMNQIARSGNATFYCDDGKANIVAAASVPSTEVIELGPDSGLIGVPEQFQYGVRCKCLLNPNIRLASLYRLDNSKIIAAQRTLKENLSETFYKLDTEGLYRVFAITYIGDTRGQDWYMEIDSVAQAGELPGFMQSYIDYGV